MPLTINCAVPKCKSADSSLRVVHRPHLTHPELPSNYAPQANSSLMFFFVFYLFFFYLNLRTCSSSVIHGGKLNSLPSVVQPGVAKPLGAPVTHGRILYPLSPSAVMGRVVNALSPSVMMSGVSRPLPLLVRPVAGLGMCNQSPAQEGLEQKPRQPARSRPRV